MFIYCVRNKITCNFLANEIQKWFNENGGKQEKELTFMFSGKESFFYMKHFPNLIKMLISNILNTGIWKILIKVHLQSKYFCQLLPYTTGIRNFDLDDLNLMKKTGETFFK